jgi:hypothetical protein
MSGAKSGSNYPGVSRHPSLSREGKSPLNQIAVGGCAAFVRTEESGFY